MNTQLEMQDCYLKAEEGEPKFTLLARDPLAANLVKLWAALRANDVLEALYLVGQLVATSINRYKDNEDHPDKIASAVKIANDMTNWQK